MPVLLCLAFRLRSCSEGSEPDSDDGDTWAIRQGAKHQAAIPALRQRPASGPTASEAKYSSAPVSHSLSYVYCLLFVMLVPLQ
jgi:hypothetical protein